MINVPSIFRLIDMQISDHADMLVLVFIKLVNVKKLKYRDANNVFLNRVNYKVFFRHRVFYFPSISLLVTVVTIKLMEVVLLL